MSSQHLVLLLVDPVFSLYNIRKGHHLRVETWGGNVISDRYPKWDCIGPMCYNYWSAFHFNKGTHMCMHVQPFRPKHSTALRVHRAVYSTLIRWRQQEAFKRYRVKMWNHGPWFGLFVSFGMSRIVFPVGKMVLTYLPGLLWEWRKTGNLRPLYKLYSTVHMKELLLIEATWYL